MTNVLKVENLSKTFKGKVVFNNISQTFYGGNVYGISGENGSGKTVFMKCLCDLLPVDQGNVRFNEQRKAPPKGTFGIIIEAPGFLLNFSGYSNLKMLASLQRKVTKQEIIHLLDDVGLSQDVRKRVGKYSLGMRQRLGIAQAMMDDPPVLLLDEPFNGLDKNAVQKTYELIKQLKDKGKIIILASHHSQDIEYLCDFVFELMQGKLYVRR